MKPRRSNTSLPAPGRSAYGAATAAALLLIPVIVLVGGDDFREFLNFGAGVLALVALTSSVVWGLVASDRLFLSTRQRLVAQAVHRTTAVSSVAFLLLHITVKLALEHTSPIGALIPFGLGVTGSAGLIGLGSLAALLMIFTAVTGALRSAFASPAPVAARWRAVHMLAYPAWCAALVHGLYAGRAAKPYVTVSYSLCLFAVLGALALRSAPAPFKREVAARFLAAVGEQGASRPSREEREASRGGAADGPLPGYAGRQARRSAAEDTFVPSQRAQSPERSLYETSAGRAAGADGGPTGFAAAYRAVSGNPAGAAGGDAPAGRLQTPPDAQPTEVFPRVDGGGSTSGNWPIPSPPPVGEAPRSAYDPLTDTGYSLPTYDNPAAGGYGASDVYDTGESNGLHGTYNTYDTYDSGPTTDVLPGAFDAPGPGEPWNAPSGGY
ncbi:cytochrome b/b6 domain-containing protein [Streptomyces sp. NPDC008313]|uniref:cytochrome b/b6 domain-containing protein n=1 Tax=Streptomyces sp. NPDC008313 TaxID=3364826 RepID=UPI0036EB36A5